MTPGPVPCPDKVHTGDVSANDPATVAGLSGVTRIAGALTLQTGALGDLGPLRCLREVDGELVIQGSEHGSFAPDILAPLAGLQRVGGALTIDRIQGLARPSLSSLTSVGGDLRIINLPQLVDLGGLEKLSDVQGQLMVARNQALGNLDGLRAVRQAAEVLVLENPSLLRVGGLSALVRTGRLKFARNPSLQTLAGLEQVTSVQALVLEDNDALTDIRALGRLTQVDLELLILGNAQLASLAGLEALAQVPPRFEIEDNASLISLDGLKSLAAPGQPDASLRIANNAALLRLGPWQHWVQGQGGLHIVSNPALQSLSGLENLSSIGALTLHGPDQVVDLHGLKSLRSVARRLSIGARERWVAVQGLPALNDVGQLEVVGMTGLEDLTRFETVPTIKSLRLMTLPKLKTLRSFAALTRIDGDLWFDDLSALPDLEGLNQISEITGRLVLSRVNQIKDLKALSALRTVGTIVVANNAQLLNLDGLEGLSRLTQGEGGLCLHQNPVMEQFNALAGIKQVDGSVTMTENPALQTVQGFSGLTDIGTSLWIDGSPKVTTLAPFAQLRRIGGRAWSFNDTCPAILAPRESEGPAPQPYHGFMGIEVRMMNIENLKGFENLENIKGGISIKENPLMTDLSDMFGVRVEGVTVEVRLNPKMEQCHALSIMKNLAFFDGGDIRIWDNLGEDEQDCG